MEPQKTPSGFWKNFFFVLGIIFAALLLLIAGAVITLIIVKPYGIDVTSVFNANNKTPFDHPLLSPQQEKTLQQIGIDPATLPTTVTPAQTQCAINAIGKSRVNAILAGATPSMTEILALKRCL